MKYVNIRMSKRLGLTELVVFRPFPDANVAYSPCLFSKRFKTGEEVVQDFFAVSQKVSHEVRRSIDCELDLAYGPTENQKIDIYGAKTLPAGSPVFVFVHGGYWVAGCRQESAVMAKCLYDSKIITATMGYDLAPSVSLDQMVEEAVLGIRFMSSWAESRGSKIWLCGFSAGSHLISMALSKEGFPMLGGVILVAGVYDLAPLVETYVSRDAGFDRDAAVRNSPQLKVPDICSRNRTEFLVVTAGNDAPTFKEQSKVFYEALRNCGANTRIYHVEDVDHYDIITNLQFPNFSLTKEMVKMIKEGNL